MGHIAALWPLGNWKDIGSQTPAAVNFRCFHLFEELQLWNLGCRGNETKRNGQMMGVSTASQYRGICEESSKTNYPDEVLKHLSVGQTVGGFHTSVLSNTALKDHQRKEEAQFLWYTVCKNNKQTILKEVAHEQPRYWTVPVLNDVIILV